MNIVHLICINRKISILLDSGFSEVRKSEVSDYAAAIESLEASLTDEA